MAPFLLNVKSCEVQHLPSTPTYVSDHHPVLMTLRVPSNSVPCLRCFRIDEWILHDPDARVLLRQHLILTTVAPVATLADWDCLKRQWPALPPCAHSARHDGSHSRSSLSGRVILRHAGLPGGTLTALLTPPSFLGDRLYHRPRPQWS